MQVLLRIANGKSNVRKVRIQSDTVIGRSPDCQLKVASNQISRRHCQIVIRDTIVAIKDLGSANGTFVNGRQVPPEVEIPLTPGTRVMLGPLQFTVEYELPGMSAVAVPAAAAVESAGAGQPQAQIETRQVVPPDDHTPFPPYVVVPPKEAAPQPGATPAAAVPAPISAGPPPTDIAIPAMMAAVAAAVPVATPVAVAPPPVAAPAPVVPAAVVPPPAAPQFFVPGGDASEGSEEGGEFNFGIFAASGSDVIVESSPEISMVPEPEEPAAPPEPAKPAKKGLLQMFGWGKKKAAAPEPEPEPVAEEEAAEAEAEVPANEEELVMEPPAATDGPSFEFPVAGGGAPASGDSSDESLENFFNNFK